MTKVFELFFCYMTFHFKIPKKPVTAVIVTRNNIVWKYVHNKTRKQGELQHRLHSSSFD